MNPEVHRDAAEDTEPAARDGRLLWWGAGLLVAGLALIALSPVIFRTVGVRSAYDELIPFAGLGLFAAGWMFVGVGLRPRGSALIGAVAAFLAYEVAGFAAVIASQAIAFHESISALLGQPLALLGFVQMWPIGLMFAFRVFGWGPQ